jgi:hypothetical protein
MGLDESVPFLVDERAEACAVDGRACGRAHVPIGAVLSRAN